MAATRKRLIPVEFLRRSCRNLGGSTTGPICDRPIKKEKLGPECNDQKQGRVMLVPQDQHRTTSSKKRDPGTEIKIESKCSIDDRYCSQNADGFLHVDPDELDLERTLLGGQSFRWTKTHREDGSILFTGVIGQHVFELWRCDNQRIAFRKLNIEGQQPSGQIQLVLEDYFQLKYKLKYLYEKWSQGDRNFAMCSQSYSGFRILRQDPVENVFSFICATNNNIKRIGQMIDKMCRQFGTALQVRPTAELITQDTYQTFPSVQRLAEDDVFQSLRFDLGFGYRAKFICETAKRLVALSKSCHQTPSEYLVSLRELTYTDTCKQLQSFPGIGRKVADCICLMSMDHLQSVPIDCHIYEIVCRNYMPNLRQERKTLTANVHDLIGSYFNDLYGPLAGWATSVLFIAELKHLKQPNTGKRRNKMAEKVIRKQEVR